MMLYRSVGLDELALIYDSGMKTFPARLPQQPIFYPVLQLEYARQTASDWNVKSGQLAGYVTQFKLEDEYASQFERHVVGESQYLEFWIPAEEMEEFNEHIVGHIKVVEAHFGDAFQGFVPDKFGLQGKNAVEQFTLLTNSYIYKRVDFYLEIRRNHKAVFLNYPFWQKYDFKNPKLKERILREIKETWFTSFPQIPLVSALPQDTTSIEHTASHSLANPISENITLAQQRGPDSPLTPAGEGISSVEELESQSLTAPVPADAMPTKQTDSQSLAKRVPADTMPVKQTASTFSQGVELGLAGKYREAIEKLSKVVEEDLNHVVAYTSLGVALHRLGEDDRALTCYETALKIDPKYAEAHYFQANILYSHGKVREALAGYTVSIGLEPGLIESHRQSTPPDRLTDYTGSPAEVYWIAKPAHRILDLNESLKANPEQANLFRERATEYYRLWNYEQAIADYSSCLAIQPDDASSLHLRGLAYEQMGQFDRALEDYRQAISINPQLSVVYINRGIAFGKMGNFRQSVASLTEGIRLAPRSSDGYFNRGVSYFQQGDFEAAIADFSMAIQLSPNDQDAYYWRGIAYEGAGQQQDAMADYSQLLAISPNSRVREEIEGKLRQWDKGKGNGVSSQGVIPGDMQKTNAGEVENIDQGLDLYDLITALGERALSSAWLASGVDCYGENAEELFSFTEHNRPMAGHDFLRITSGIRQTIEGDFTAFDPDSASHWILIRAWNGNGFYIETSDPESKELLRTHFPSAEEVEGASAPYEGLFIST